jgi:hypothetical protein
MIVNDHRNLRPKYFSDKNGMKGNCRKEENRKKKS